MSQISIHRPKRPHLLGARDRIRKPERPTPENPLILSASELRDFLRCRVMWNWRHQARIIPKKKPIPLAFGIFGHQAMERFYGLERAKRTIKGMKRVVKAIARKTTPDELSIENVELATAMLTGYASWSKPRDREIGVGKVSVEKWFDLPLVEDGSIRVHGKIDAAFKPSAFKRTMAGFEHKFKSQLRINSIELNLQLSVYLWALRKLYPEARRYIAYYNVLRKQMPGPRVRSELFAREAVERTDDEIDAWEMDAQRIALDMLDAAIYPNPTDACGWDCDYNVPCLLRGNPKDVRHILKTEYQRKG